MTPEREHRVLLWRAINQYVIECGGDPGKLVYGNTRRQSCVAEVESLVYRGLPAQRSAPVTEQEGGSK